MFNWATPKLTHFMSMKFLYILFSIVLMTCNQSYKVGGTGEAGGIIFYDSGEYGIKGWRYMEVAPDGWSGEKEDPFVGWGRYSDNEVLVAVDTEIGSGSNNTKLIRNDKSYSAAKKISEYSYRYKGEEYNDWFMPSREELELICKNLAQHRIGNFRIYDSYWSSSEYYPKLAWSVDFKNGDFVYTHKGGISAIRPIRAF